jgi:Tol biopolymer transport system component
MAHMTPDRWKRIEELYHAARARPSGERVAYLVEICGDDESMRHEVQSLLNEPATGGGFLDTPAHATASDSTETTLATMTGHTLGGYHLQALLGVGGMGEVYAARDAKLGRDVAIKILPRALTSDPDRLARFDREARMLAALNHPNICAIYGLEEAGGVRFLILERVNGPTLAERIHQSGTTAGLGLGEVLSISRQIAEALEAAHDKGIVHRDLKPANIKITPSDVVKVLDFGLAKPTNDASASDLTKSPTVSIGATRDGVILGTVAYMSPEQARGKAIDKRTDIWAFGCVLYEMLTARVPFDGETVSDTIGKILEREPDWSALPVGTPAAIRRLLLRCFAKDPKQRLRDIGDVRIEIDAMDEVLSGSDAPVTSAKARAAWLPWAASALFAALVVISGVWALRPAATTENPLANARFSRLTDWEGTEGAGEISPDGKFVAFVADKAGQFDIWLSQIGSGSIRNLTTELPPLQPTFSTFRKTGFSADGAEIWFSVAAGPSMAQMVMPLVGGTPHAFLDTGATAPSWSPVDQRVTYFKNDVGDPLFVGDRMGADARQILIEKGMHHHNPVWSTDGQWIYFAGGAEPTDTMDVWRIRPSGESLERLTDDGIAINFLAPIDTRTLLYVGSAPDGSGPWLWSLDVERKASRRVDSGLGQYTSVSASHDGSRIVVTIANPRASLWRVPLLDRQAEDRDVERYPLRTERALAPRFRGGSLFYLSASGSGDGLWRAQNGQEPEQVWGGGNGILSEPPAVSPDGSRVAIIVRREGKRRLAIVSADGRSTRALAPSIDIQGQAGQGTVDWSPDGNSIVTGGDDGKGLGLFVIPVNGGPPVRLVAGKANNPIWSPDGQLILYAGNFFTGQIELLGVRPDGTPVALPPVRTRPGGYRFLPNGKGLVYLPTFASLDFWLIDFATKTPRQITRLSNQGALSTFDITPDGKAIVFDRSRENSDIVLIERPK